MNAQRINARSLMWALDYVKLMFANLEANATVTQFELGEIEFEIVVTKIGNKRLPRVAAPLAQAGSNPPKES